MSSKGGIAPLGPETSYSMTRDIYYAAACQTAFDCPKSRDGIAANVDRMCTMAENTILGYEPFHEVRLLVFPEFAHAAPIYDSVSKLKERLALPLPNEHVDRYHTCLLYTSPSPRDS